MTTEAGSGEREVAAKVFWMVLCLVNVVAWTFAGRDSALILACTFLVLWRLAQDTLFGGAA